MQKTKSTTGKNSTVPFGDIKREYKEIKKEIDAAVMETLKSGYFVLGEKGKNLETAFAAYIGKGSLGVAVNSGTDALKLSLMAAGVGVGDYVITVPNTAVPTVSAISDVGAVPLLCDIDEKSMTISADKLGELLKQNKRKLGKKLKVIIPVHLYGQSCEMDKVMKLASENGLLVIEDACQAHGAAYKGKKVGNFGAMTAFSFYPSKNLGAYGDGGMIITGSEKMKDKLVMLRNYGQKQRYYHEIIGVNSRLDELQAAILLAKLKHLDAWNKRRMEIAARYTKAIKNPEIEKPLVSKHAKHVFHLYVIRTDRRDELAAYLKEAKIGTLIHYPVPIHLQNAYKSLGYKPGAFPVSERNAKRILSLPVFPQLTNTEIARVAEVINSF